MPLTDKGKKILAEMQEQYGKEKGEEVFYASKNAGKITGVDEAVRFYTTIQLSENISETPDGYLLCQNVPITRIGEFLYKGSELTGPDGKPLVEPTSDGMVRIQRDEDEVFSEITIKSFEAKPLTLDHPKGFVGPENWQDLAHGTIQNVHRGTEETDLLLADIMVTTEKAINLIKAGQRELSCGYDAEYSELSPGVGKQHSIVGNHVALVSKGRAGGRCSIQDSKACTGCGECTCGKNKKTTDQEAKMTVKERIMQFLDSLNIKDEDTETPEEKAAKEKAEAEAKEKEAKDKYTKDQDEKISGLEERLKRIEDMLAELLSEETEDAAEETEEEKAAREKKEAEEKETKDAEESKEKEEAEEHEKTETEAEEKKEEKETTDAWPDVLSHSEILVPGIRLQKPKTRATLDAIKVEVLDAATKNAEYGKEIEKMLRYKKPSILTGDALDTAFIAASSLVSTMRNAKVQRPQAPRYTTDTAAITAREINERNKKFYAQK